MTHETDSTARVVVDKSYHWQPIDEHTPRGQKLQLIHRPSGVANYGILGTGSVWETHWCKVPTFED